MPFISASFFPGLLFYCACFALAAQFLSCLLVALRRFRRVKNNARDNMEGVTLLYPVCGGGQKLEQSLHSAFALKHRRKEIIFCVTGEEKSDNKAGSALIRRIREENADTASLLIAGDNLVKEGAAKGEEGTACLVKAWQAARYDWVAVFAPDSVLPPDCLAGFFTRWRSGEKKPRNRKKRGEETEFFAAQAAADWGVGAYHKASAGRQAPTGLVCAALWGVRPQGFHARLEAAFLNSWRARRLLLADSFGRGVAQDGAQFWHYDIMNAAGGIKAFAQAAEKSDIATAATQFIREQGKKIRLAALPLPKDLSPAAPEGQGRKRGFSRFRALLREQIIWLKFYRRFLPRLFYAELLLGAFLPVLAMLLACLGGAAPVLWFIGFLALWYGVEAVFLCWFGRALKAGCGAAGIKQGAALLLRDIILPFLWLYSLLKA